MEILYLLEIFSINEWIHLNLKTIEILNPSQKINTCSKLAKEILEEGVI